MKSDWTEKKLGDFCEVKGGKRLPKGINLVKENSGHPYIRIRDLTNKKYIQLDDDFEFVDIETQKLIGRYIVDDGDILISIVGTIGLVSIVGETLKNANLTENCVKLTNLQGIDHQYLYYYLVSCYGQNEIKRGTVGAVQPKLPIKNIQDITIRYPIELKEQKKIASILKTLDDKIALNNEINKNLQQQIQAIFKAWFIDNPAIGEWGTGTFSDIILTTIAGDWGKEVATGNYNEKVYCIRGADIPEVKNGNKGKMPTRFILPKNYKAKKLVADDIVVEISGGSPTQSTGRATAISQYLLDRYDNDMICTNFCKALKPKKGYSMFVYHYWQYMYDNNIFFSYENGTTGIKNLDLSGILNTEEIVIPPNDIINQFNEICQATYAQIYANGAQNEKLAEHRDTLIPKLMSGELDVSNIDI